MTALDEAPTPVASPPVAEDAVRRRRRRSGAMQSVLKHAGLIVLSLLMIYPLIWLVISSLKPNSEIFTDLGIFTTDLTLENYVHGWTSQQLPFGRFLINSSILVLGAIVGNLVSCSLAAYAFARLRFWGRNAWFAIMLGTIMLPFHVVLVPQFIIFRELGWLETFLPLVVPKFLAMTRSSSSSWSSSSADCRRRSSRPPASTAPATRASSVR
jgi:multiple sugar transport system permease protein